MHRFDELLAILTGQFYGLLYHLLRLDCEIIKVHAYSSWGLYIISFDSITQLRAALFFGVAKYYLFKVSRYIL